MKYRPPNGARSNGELMHEGGGVRRRRPGKLGVRAGFYVGCRTAGDAVRGCGGPRVRQAVTCHARKSVRVR
eukprot:6685082-Prymnesium_polylepis.1